MNNDNLNEKIDKYYKGDLEKGEELKVALDRMNAINGIEEKIQLNIDVAEVIEKGESIKLRKATTLFISIASMFSLFLLTLASKLDFAEIVGVQFGLLVLLLMVNIFSRSNKLKEHRS